MLHGRSEKTRTFSKGSFHKVRRAIQRGFGEVQVLAEDSKPERRPPTEGSVFEVCIAIEGGRNEVRIAAEGCIGKFYITIESSRTEIRIFIEIGTNEIRISNEGSGAEYRVPSESSRAKSVTLYLAEPYPYVSPDDRFAAFIHFQSICDSSYIQISIDGSMSNIYIASFSDGAQDVICCDFDPLASERPLSNEWFQFSSEHRRLSPSLAP
jgi:hypothetical protein